MAMPYHEPPEQLPEDVKEMHRALNSLIEELEAINWYNQRAAVAPDADLKDVLLHNRDEEVEHACMVLEWIRRKYPVFDENLRTYLFTSGSITAVEEAADAGEDVGGEASEAGSAPAASGSGSLGIGSLKR